MDKAGNFIGWLHIEGVNLSVALVETALSKVHFTAERSAYYKALVSAEEACRQKKEKVGLIISGTETTVHTVGEVSWRIGPPSHKADLMRLLGCEHPSL